MGTTEFHSLAKPTGPIAYRRILVRRSHNIYRPIIYIYVGLYMYRANVSDHCFSYFCGDKLLNSFFDSTFNRISNYIYIYLFAKFFSQKNQSDHKTGKFIQCEPWFSIDFTNLLNFEQFCLAPILIHFQVTSNDPTKISRSWVITKWQTN